MDAGKNLFFFLLTCNRDSASLFFSMQNYKKNACGTWLAAAELLKISKSVART